METEIKDATKILVMTPVNRDELWSSIFGSGYEYSTEGWLYSIDFTEGDWEKHGVAVVKYEDPDTGTATRRTLTIADLANAVSDLNEQGWTHCDGCVILEDDDACVGDAVIQQALFGDLIFG
jgi:hypothetical protein